jgi:hypothetical protein
MVLLFNVYNNSNNHSVCHLVPIGGQLGGTHSLAAEGVRGGGPSSDDWRRLFSYLLLFLHCSPPIPQFHIARKQIHFYYALSLFFIFLCLSFLSLPCPSKGLPQVFSTLFALILGSADGRPVGVIVYKDRHICLNVRSRTCLDTPPNTVS